MRILFLSKRHPQQRDLLDRPYGRFHHLPVELAARGHAVTSLLVSHHRLESMERQMGDVCWLSHDLFQLGPHRLYTVLFEQTQKFNPDVIVGCSDAWTGWLAYRLAKRIDAALLIDAYDNYESYMPWNFPLHWGWRRAVAAADWVTAAGPQLAELLAASRDDKTLPVVVPMAADPSFVVTDRHACRLQLDLPSKGPLIGYSGGWAANRGTEMLAEVFRRIHAAQPEARFVLSGRPPREILKLPGTLALGYLEDEVMPVMLNALDIACIVTTESKFGQYSYPAKLCEAMACGIPVVATDTAPVRWMLGGDERFLVPINHPKAFAERVLINIAMGRIDYGPKPDWVKAAAILESLLTT